MRHPWPICLWGVHVSHSESRWWASRGGHMLLRYWEKDAPFLLGKLKKMTVQSNWAPSLLHIFAEHEHRRMQGWEEMRSFPDDSIWAPALSHAWMYYWSFQLEEPEKSSFCFVIWFSFLLKLKVSLIYTGPLRRHTFSLTCYPFQYLKLAVLYLHAFPWQLRMARWRVIQSAQPCINFLPQSQCQMWEPDVQWVTKESEHSWFNTFF